MIDVKEIQKKAKQELSQERSEEAVEKLKELYQKREKALLIVKNIDREIEGYLVDIGENTVYESAGVDTTKK